MKEFIVGLISGTLIYWIMGCFLFGFYAVGVILCFIMVTSIYLVFDKEKILFKALKLTK